LCGGGALRRSCSPRRRGIKVVRHPVGKRVEQECDGRPQTGDCLSVLWDDREKKWSESESEPCKQARAPLAISTLRIWLRRAVEYLACVEDKRPDHDG